MTIVIVAKRFDCSSYYLGDTCVFVFFSGIYLRLIAKQKLSQLANISILLVEAGAFGGAFLLVIVTFLLYFRLCQPVGGERISGLF